MDDNYIAFLQKQLRFLHEKDLHIFDTEAKLHFAYTSKNLTDNDTGKNWMSKTLSLKSFLNDARQLLVYMIAKWRKPTMTH